MILKVFEKKHNFSWASRNFLLYKNIYISNIFALHWLKCTSAIFNCVFFLKILKYSGLWSFSVLPRCQCVFTRRQKISAAAKLAEKNHKILRKITIFYDYLVSYQIPMHLSLFIHIKGVPKSLPIQLLRDIITK